MKGIIAFLQGVGLKCVRPAIYGWFFNIFFSIFIYYGYYKAFSIPAGNALISADNGTEIGTFTFLADILQHYQGSVPLVFSLAGVFTMGFILASIYVSGGIYSVLVEEEKTSFTNLIAQSTQNFFSMLKIALINLLNLIVALIIPVLMLIMFFSIKAMYSDETVIRVFFWIWAAVTALFLTFSTAIYDFSRIIRLKEERNILYSFKKGIKFTFSNKVNVLAIFLLYALSLVIIYLVYLVIMGLVQHFLFAFLLFCMYQAFIMTRYYLKIVVMRAEIRIVD